MNEETQEDKKKAKVASKKLEENKIKEENEVNIENKTEIKNDSAAERKALIYLGPNISGGILSHGAVFKEYPKHLAELFERTPEIKKLFVDIKKIVAFKEALNRKGSEESRLYQQVLISMRGN